MKKSFFLIVVLPFLAAADEGSDLISDARDWYVNDYGSHWINAETSDPANIPRYYVDNYRVHLPNGGFSFAKNTPAEWQEFKDSVGSEWIGSEIQELKIVALSTSSVSIKAQWINRRENAPSFVSCDSYIAAKTSEGGWIFTNYLVVDCDSLTREWR